MMISFGTYGQTDSMTAGDYFRQMDSLFTLDPDSSEGGKKADYLRNKQFVYSRLKIHESFKKQGDNAISSFRSNDCNFLLENVCEETSATDFSNWRQVDRDFTSKKDQGVISSIWNTNAGATNPFILAGGYISGLWKSIDDGEHWTNLTDKLHLPSLGVSSITVDPANNDRIWIGTNRPEGLGGYGIFYTDDGGVNWCHQTLPDNLFWQGLNENNVIKVIIHPTNANYLACITDLYVYKSINGGNTWTKAFFMATSSAIPKEDIMFCDIIADGMTDIYVATKYRPNYTLVAAPGQMNLIELDNFWNSTINPINHTATFIANFPPFGFFGDFAFKLARNNNALFINLQLPISPTSIDFKNHIIKFDGTVFTLLTSSAASSSYIDKVGSAFEIAPNSTPNNANLTFYLGGVPAIKKVNYTTTNTWVWTNAKGYNYGSQPAGLHDDIRAIFCNNSTNKVYIGHDGGISNALETAIIWTSINGDLNNSDVGGMSVSENDGAIMISKNHNYSWVKYKDNYLLTLGGDGYESRFEKNYKVKNSGFQKSNFGGLYKTTKLFNNYQNNGYALPSTFNLQSYNNSSSGFGSFYTIQNLGGNSILNRIEDQYRNTITSIAAFNWTTHKIELTTFGVSESNPNVVYIGILDGNSSSIYDRNQIYKTTTGNFNTIYSILNLGKEYRCNTICVDPDNENRFWAGYGNSQPLSDLNSNRVICSFDGGLTITDISEGLPRFPVNKLVYDNQNRTLYAATDVGVYYAKMPDILIISGSFSNWEGWKCFNKDMPTVMVTDLEINHCTNKLYASSAGRGVWNSELLSNDFLDETNIGSTFVVTPAMSIITWAESKNYEKTIIIKKGGQLIIEGTATNQVLINMARKRAIIIEPGGSMVVKYATITNECGTMWSGIRVLGDPAFNHPIMSGALTSASVKSLASKQGILWLKNAIIENAHVGIGTYGISYQPNDDFPYIGGNVNGGVIVVENSEINDCFVGVNITPCKVPHWSRFLNCKFKATKFLEEARYAKLYSNTNTTKKHGTVTFFQASTAMGIRIEGCEFVNNVIPSSSYDVPVDFWPLGIGSFDASLKISGNTFNRCNYGIDMVCTPLSTAVSNVYNNTMNATWRGIHLAGVNKWHSIQNNTILLTYNESNTIGVINPCNSKATNNAWGIYDDNSSGAVIMDNNINYIPNYNITPYDENYGIIINNTNTLSSNLANAVRRNTINNIRYGIISIGNNDKSQLTCNNFINNIGLNAGFLPYEFVSFGVFHNKDYECNPINDGSLQNPQGACGNNVTMPAGNVFQNCNGTIPTDINHYYIENGVTPIVYNEHINSPYLVEPCKSASLLEFQCGSGACPSFTICCADPPINPKTDWIPNDYQNHIALLLTQENNKKDLIDGGDTDALLDAIALATNNSSYVMQLLLDAGNYLSDEVLLATIDRSNPLTNYDLKTVLIFNSPLSEKVYNRVAIIRPIVAYNYIVYIAQQAGISPIRILHSEIQTIQAEKDADLASLVDLYLAQNLPITAANALAVNGKTQAAIAMYIFANDYTNAQLLINGLEDLNLKAICNINMYYVQNNINLQAITDPDKAILETLQNNYTNAGIYAANILRIATGQKSIEALPNAAIISNSQRKVKHEIYNTDILPETNFSIYPNPANNIINILNYGIASKERFTISIFDITGRLVISEPLQKEKLKTSLDVSSLQLGTYTLKILSSNKTVFIDKLIIK